MKGWLFYVLGVVALALMCALWLMRDRVDTRELDRKSVKLEQLGERGSDRVRRGVVAQSRASRSVVPYGSDVVNPEEVARYVRDLAVSLEGKLRSGVDTYAEELKLTKEQVSRLKVAIKKKRDEYELALTALMRGEENEDTGEVNFLIESGIDDFFVQILSADQLDLYYNQKKERAALLASEAATKTLANLESLDLSDHQNDALYELIMNDSTEPEFISAVDFIRLEAMGEEAVMGRLGLRSYFDNEPEGSWDSDAEGVARRFIDSRVNRFSGVLNEEQSDLYRKYLERQLAPIL